jgi:hypothetical protein
MASSENVKGVDLLFADSGAHTCVLNSLEETVIETIVATNARVLSRRRLDDHLAY